MTTRCLVYGASGHGKVVADILLGNGVTVVGFVDDALALRGSTLLGRPVLGRLDDVAGAFGGATVALGIGRNDIRERVAARVESLGFSLQTAIHRSAVVAASATVGAGAVVMALAAINPDAVVGRGAIVNTGAVVEHDCVLGDFAHVSPNAALAGGVTVGAGTHVGTGAAILPLVRVGARSVVGAGAVVRRDVGDDRVVAGVPARLIR